jgi:hypothetical protein
LKYIASKKKQKQKLIQNSECFRMFSNIMFPTWNFFNEIIIIGYGNGELAFVLVVKTKLL